MSPRLQIKLNALLDRFAALQERLQASEGSASASCSAGREAAKEQGDERLGCAVPPGKAKAELVCEWLLHIEANARLLCRWHVPGKRRMELASGIEDVARCARELLLLIAEPDSEASFSERSGRRNSEL